MRKKEIKDTYRKEEIKLSLFADAMMVCVDIPLKLQKKNPTPNFLEVISDYSKLAGYNINVQNWVSFPYTSKEQAEF